MKTDKEILAATPVAGLEVWNHRGAVDRFALNARLAQLRLAGDLDTVEAITDALERFRGQLTVDLSDTIGVSRSKVREIRNFAAAVAETDDYLLVELDLVKSERPKVLPHPFESENLPYGLWEVSGEKSVPFSTFDQDFASADASLIAALESSGFRRTVRSRVPGAFRVVKNARIHDFDKNFYTVSFDEEGERVFDRSFAARVASESMYNALPVNAVVQDIDFAIILPIEVANVNYFHALSEKIFGMRMLSLFRANAPIIHTSDPFGLVEQFASRLDVPAERLISFEQAKHFNIKTALLISAGPYSWTTEVFEFFRSLAPVRCNPARKIYISREGSRREFSNERELQEMMARAGYEVVRPERLSIEAQVEIFGQAKTVVAGHGAGLANIAFMSRGTRLVELFPRNMIKPDYYLRSRTNGMDYALLVAGSDGEIDVRALSEIITLNKILVVGEDGGVAEVSNYPGLEVSFAGTGNLVKIEEGSVFSNSKIEISNDSFVYISRTNRRGIRNARISMAGSMSNKRLIIGKNIQIESAHISMAGEDDLTVVIGEDNLWSSNITVRATDGHPIFDMAEPSVVVNRSSPVVIGNRVWIGSSAVIMKGSKICADSVVGQGALVAKAFNESNVVIAGNPGKIVKRGILWRHEYIAREPY